MKITLSSTFTALRDDEQPFRLFDLPREIRDIIYMNTDAKHITTIQRWHSIETSKRYAPAMRLVSRQIIAEYDDTWYRTTAFYLHQYTTMLPNLNLFRTLSMLPTIEHMYRSLQEVVLGLTHNSDKRADVLAAEVDCALRDLANILPELRRVSIRIDLANMLLDKSKLLCAKVGKGYTTTIDATYLDWPNQSTCQKLACAKLAIDDMVKLVRGKDELKVSCDFIVHSRLYSVNRQVVKEDSLATLMQNDLENRILWRVLNVDGIVAGMIPREAASVEFLEAGLYDYAMFKQRHDDEKAAEARRHADVSLRMKRRALENNGRIIGVDLFLQ